MPISKDGMGMILALSCSTLQVVIAHLVLNYQDMACKKYGQQCSQPENIKKRTQVSIIGQWFVVPQGKIVRTPNLNISDNLIFS